MTRRFALPFALAATLGVILAGCQTISPEAKVRQRLIDAGLKPRLAECMADRLVSKLSIGQLQELGRAAKLTGRDVRQMTVDEILYRLRAVQDPRIVTVVTRAGVGCMIAG